MTNVFPNENSLEYSSAVALMYITNTMFVRKYLNTYSWFDISPIKEANVTIFFDADGEETQYQARRLKCY